LRRAVLLAGCPVITAPQRIFFLCRNDQPQAEYKRSYVHWHPEDKSTGKKESGECVISFVEKCKLRRYISSRSQLPASPSGRSAAGTNVHKFPCRLHAVGAVLHRKYGKIVPSAAFYNVETTFARGFDSSSAHQIFSKLTTKQ